MGKVMPRLTHPKIELEIVYVCFLEIVSIRFDIPISTI